MPGPVAPAVRVRALLAGGGLAVIQGELTAAAAAGEEAAELCERAEDPTGLAHALQFLGFVAIYTEDYERATRLLSRALGIARTAERRWLTGRSLLFLAITALAVDDHDLAARLAAECAEAVRSVGDLDSLHGAQIIGAAAAWRAGDHPSAAARLREGVLGYQSLGGLWGVSLGLAIAAYLAGAAGDHRRLVSILSASEAVRTSMGAALLPFVGPWHEAAIAAAVDALGTEAFDQEWRAGAALTPDEAIATALPEARE
jgi:non-specific serine/threonine protein kinase